MTSARRPLLAPVAAAAVAALLLGACTDDDDDPAATEPTPVEGSTTSAPAETSTTAPPTSTTTAPATTEAAGPELTGCEDLRVSPNGVYRFEAGEVTMVRRGDRLVLRGVRPADGWTHHIDDEDDDDEVEIEFRRGQREIDFEAEIDDGRLEIEICADEGD